jgi:predicted Zn finger-like uncharacterized protein|tara:strand:- start:46 stop:567 length:522 start_codon:yes stop_codon:yes gene_type:complete
MILNCNSCGKKFVVPDNAITASGRVVQCGSCGNKWKQFPINAIKQTRSITSTKKIESKSRPNHQKIQKTKKAKKSAARKSREIDLYSPEYLAKKHGIKLSDDVKTTSFNNNISFGFYNYLLLFLVIIITLSRGLYFFQDFVVQKLPFTEFYIDYFFESIKNIFEIWKNLIFSY